MRGRSVGALACCGTQVSQGALLYTGIGCFARESLQTCSEPTRQRAAPGVSALPWTRVERLRAQDIQAMTDFVAPLHQRASKAFNTLRRILASHVNVEAMPCERVCLKPLLDAGLDKRGTLIHTQGMLLLQPGRSSCLEFQNKVWPLFAHCAFVRADSSRSIESDPSCTSVACVRDSGLQAGAGI
mmetsp:Transcript_63963/g.208658  ORF Transcript_63963/g.208658 Transcript_63963/m.208658 type:complete len:185 (-) Transcript_63963:116-670(-)